MKKWQIYRWIQRISYLCATVYLLIDIFYFSYLPEKLPIQIDFSGKFSNWVNKWLIFLFPVILFVFAWENEQRLKTERYHFSLEVLISAISQLLICGIGGLLFFSYTQL
ncbi:DUF1648 domain-containing protein [Enterococcus hailinensis]|uniref:DUF1648 domain-containing protein n=1 Tax=Enterococcus hailinensis TaxID=3238988 RepID=UPI0038B2E9A7